ncbi:MAG TPA: hypothetical protein VF950_06440 [Planctomycetota bacterium]
MIHVAALLFLAAVQDPEEWKREIQRLKEKLAASEAYAETLRKRVGDSPAPPAFYIPSPVVVPAPAPGGAALPKERATDEAGRAAEELLKARDRAALTRVECKVSAVAPEIGLVVLSAGADAGVRQGDAFTVQRAGEFVAKVVVDRTDRNWSAAKVTLKKSDPRVGDDVSNVVFVHAPGAPAVAPPAGELQALRRELDEVRKQVRALSDTLVPAWQGPGLALEEAPEELRAHLGIARGVLVRRVREGSAAERAGLKVNDLIPDLGEAEVLDALQKPAPIRILRQGRELKIGR